MLRDTSIQACLAQGNAASQPIDNQRYTLAASWFPSDYFETSAIRQAVAAVQSVLSQAFDISSKADDACSKAPGCSDPVYLDNYGALLSVTNQSQDYLDTANSADTDASSALQTAYVVAPGFKDWVLKALGAASDAVTGAAVTSCLMPWWSAAVVAVQNAAAAAGDVLIRILGVAADVAKATIAAGQGLAKTAKEAFDLTAWLFSSLPFLAGGVVLFFSGRYIWKNRVTLRTKLLKRSQG
jgi:hypothetical protein